VYSCRRLAALHLPEPNRGIIQSEDTDWVDEYALLPRVPVTIQHQKAFGDITPSESLLREGYVSKAVRSLLLLSHLQHCIFQFHTTRLQLWTRRSSQKHLNLLAFFVTVACEFVCAADLHFEISVKI
jgi:hypothetical protein